MNHMQFDLRPLHTAVRNDGPVSLDVLITITPPAPDRQVQRPTLNLGLVLDRSGSMEAQNKLGFAREAAVFAVQQLLPTDRVSVTIFDDHVHTIVPNRAVEDRQSIVNLLRGIRPGHTTALHAGWREGARQVSQHPCPGGLNRVLLLSDGLANVGETNADTIAGDVHRFCREGVSTTTMGVGLDFDHDLLEAMARSGDGNYYYIESPRQFDNIFQCEMRGLLATVGCKVSLGLEPQNGVTVTDVLNDLDRASSGRLMLPNLVAGMPVPVVVRLQVPPLAHIAEVCRFRLAWDVPGEAGRRTLQASLDLPVVPEAAWRMLAPDRVVQERVALLLIARAKRQASAALEQGDRDGAMRWLQDAREIVAAAPAGPEIPLEEQALAEIAASLAAGESQKFHKAARYQAHQRRTGRHHPS
jgi:Ca-activated chloride channel family protein